MSPTPSGWPRITSSLFYEQPSAAIDWLCAAFGFAVRLRIVGDDGAIHHSELTWGESPAIGVIMVSGTVMPGHPDSTWPRAPRQVGGANTQSVMVYVDDVEAHCARARAAGATIVMPPRTSDYGPGYWIDRGYEATDLEGHHWWFVQRLGDSPAAGNVPLGA